MEKLTFEQARKIEPSGYLEYRDDKTGYIVSNNEGYENPTDDWETNSGMYSQNQVNEMLNQLQQTYAPTVEMTEQEYQDLMEIKNDGGKYSKYLYFLDWAIANNLTEEQQMSAWLHPESIKVVKR